MQHFDFKVRGAAARFMKERSVDASFLMKAENLSCSTGNGRPSVLGLFTTSPDCVVFSVHL